MAEGTSESAKAQPGEPTARGPGDSADVFISYAREDAGFVRALHDRLVAQDRGVWVDWESIPYSAEWWAEIEHGIEASAAFVVILSPDSVASQICARELAHAEASHARIIPVVARDVEREPVPKSLADRNWIFFRDPDDPDAAFGALTATIDTDLAQERLHARLRVRAAEWDAGGKKRGGLLRGEDLALAEQWMATPTSRAGTTEKQYVLASRRAVGQFQRRTIGAVTLALVVAIGLSIVALVLRHQAVRQEHAAQSRALAASSLLALDDDPELSLLLARQGVLVQDTSQARQALRQALSRSHVRLTVRSPTGRVAWASFTPDGARVVAVDGNGPAHVFDARTGKLVETLSVRRYLRPLLALKLSTDGSRALLVPNIGSPVVLDVSGRAPPISLHDPSDGWPGDAALSADGRLAVTTTLHTGIARVFDARTGAILRTFPGTVGRVAISDDGRRVALSGPGSVMTYDLTNARPLATLPAPLRPYANPTFSPDGSLFTLTDREVRRWDPVTGRPGVALRGSGITGDAAFASAPLVFSTDGRWVVGTSGPGVGVWDARTGMRRTEIAPPGTSFTVQTVSPDGARVVTSSDDGVERIWDGSTGAMLTDLRGVPGGIGRADFDSTGRLVLTAGSDETARVWDAGMTLPVARQHVPSAVFDMERQGRWATDAFPSERQVEVFDARSGRRVFAVRLPRVPKEVVLADRAAVAAMVYANAPVALYDMATRRRLGALRGPGPVAQSAVLSADGRRLMTRSGDLMTVWDVRTRQALSRLRQHAPGGLPYNSESAFSPDGRLLVTIGTDGRIVLWRASDGEVLGRGTTASSPGYNAAFLVKPAFSADGRLFVAAGNWDGHPGIRRTSDGQLVATMTDAFNGIAFSPTAPLIVTDGGRVWDAESGRLLVTVANPADIPATSNPVFSPDGLRVVDQSSGLTFSCDVCGSLSLLMRLAGHRITRPFTAAERDRYLR